MRKRINKNAVCSSENYSASKRVHQEYLKELHSSFSTLAVSDTSANEELSLGRKLLAKSYMVTIWVFGKPVKVSKEEYDTYCEGFARY